MEKRIRLKVNSNNEVIIHRIPTSYEQSLIDSADMDLVTEMIKFNADNSKATTPSIKNSWSRDEVESLIFEFKTATVESDFVIVEDWIKENL